MRIFIECSLTALGVASVADVGYGGYNFLQQREKESEQLQHWHEEEQARKQAQDQQLQRWHEEEQRQEQIRDARDKREEQRWCSIL